MARNRPGPTHPAPPPAPNLRLDNYYKEGGRPKPPARRPDCALGNYVLMGDTPVCYGEGAQHNARCPEARRLARQREFWCRIYTVSILVFMAVVVGLPLLLLWKGR